MPPTNDKLCFVVMPFQDDMRDVYWSAIKPACEQAGFRSLRVDELEGVFNINKKIIQNLFLSEAIIADLTHWRPNVFYEMGVAHAIGNKTIMIIQQDHKLPFDVSDYRCIIYQQTPEGFATLVTKLVGALNSLEHWRQEPSNPVQDFMPPEAALPLPKLNALQRELDHARHQLKSVVPKAELEKLQREHRALQRELRSQPQNMIAKTEWEALHKQLQAKLAENAALEKENARLRAKLEPKTEVRTTKVEKPKRLRDQPKQLASDEVKAMLAEKGFYDSDWNKEGKGITHQYESKTLNHGKVVQDHATGLMWQQSGSPKHMTYAEAEKYIREMNSQSFAGFNDWRLPTLEEAMSLMEREKKNGNLYIDPIFDRTQWWIWTGDKASGSSCWVAYFYYGSCYDLHVDLSYYVRLVRGG